MVGCGCGRARRARVQPLHEICHRSVQGHGHEHENMISCNVTEDYITERVRMSTRRAVKTDGKDVEGRREGGHLVPRHL